MGQCSRDSCVRRGAPVRFCWCFKLGQGPVTALQQILDGIFAGGVVAVEREASFSPPDNGPPVLLFLLTDGHLPVGFQERYLAPLGHERVADGLHLRFVAPAGVIELDQH